MLLDLPQIAQAAVTTFEPEPGVVELVAYYALQAGRRAAAQRDLAGAAQQAAGLHGAGLPRAARRHPDDAQQQGRPQEAAEAAGAALLGRAQATSPPKTENERILHARARRGAAGRARLDRASFLRRPRRQLAADGALLRGDPQESRHVERVDARHLHEPDDRQARASSRFSRSKASSRRSPSRSTFPRTCAYYTCGALQLAFYAAYALFGLWVLDAGYHWAIAADSALEIYARSVVFARRIVRRADRDLDRREVGADRPLQGAVDPDLEPCAISASGSSRP